MAVVSSTLAFISLQQDNVAWKLLHAQNAPIILSILDENLGKETGKRTVADLVSLVDADLEVLRERVPEIGPKRSARDYCEQWRRDGYLVRKPLADSRQETYELSAGALAAISFAKGLAKPHRAATKSRLNMILNQIAELSLATDCDIDRRRKVLLAEKQRIEDQLAELDQGTLDTMDPDQALEQARDILNLAQEIPRDFVSVSAEFEEIAKNLYIKLIGYEEGYQDTLEGVFAGIDHITQSPPGQSFGGFYALLRDSEALEKLQDDIDSILDTDFACMLEAEERRFLRRFVQTLLDQARDVNETKTGLSRGLRKLVQSQSFQQDRVLRRFLDQTLGMASVLTESYSCTFALPIELELTKTMIAPISRLELYNPADASAQPIPASAFEENGRLTLAELYEQVREVEIDYDELVGNVNAFFAERDASNSKHPSIGEILDKYPATQGIASIAGLMVLASDQGIRTNESEIIRWQSKSGRHLQARVDTFLFVKEVR